MNSSSRAAESGNALRGAHPTKSPTGSVAAYGGLTARQFAMLCQSEPDPRDPHMGYGFELWTGADYAVARSLAKRGLGSWEQGPKGNCGLYFNNAEGLELRADLLGEKAEEESWEAINDAAFEEMCRKLP